MRLQRFFWAGRGFLVVDQWHKFWEINNYRIYRPWRGLQCILFVLISFVVQGICAFRFSLGSCKTILFSLLRWSNGVDTAYKVHSSFLYQFWKKKINTIFIFVCHIHWSLIHYLQYQGVFSHILQIYTYLKLTVKQWKVYISIQVHVYLQNRYDY